MRFYGSKCVEYLIVCYRKGTTILQVVPLLLKIKIAKLVAHCYNIDRETKEPGGLPSYFGGVNPPDARKEGVANVYYIL